MDLCLKCHNKEVFAYDGSPLINIPELLQNNTMHHGPIKAKDCSGCHSPHGSNYYRLLLAEYPKDFYIDTFNENNYKLCFLCHEIYASNNFNHIRESVPFGKIRWPLQLKYQ